MIINIVLICICFLCIFCIAYYNDFTKIKNDVDESLSNIDTLLKERFDLIPNLVDTIKGYTSHEKGVFKEVTELRANYLEKSIKNSKQKMELDNNINHVLVIAEKYPDLKANHNFIELQNELNNLEDKIQKSRESYNRQVTYYNNKIQTFPGILFSLLFNFKKVELFSISNEEKENQTIKF